MSGEDCMLDIVAERSIDQSTQFTLRLGTGSCATGDRARETPINSYRILTYSTVIYSNLSSSQDRSRSQSILTIPYRNPSVILNLPFRTATLTSRTSSRALPRHTRATMRWIIILLFLKKRRKNEIGVRKSMRRWPFRETYSNLWIKY